MKFGVFYEHQLPRDWDEFSEHRLIGEGWNDAEDVAARNIAGCQNPHESGMSGHIAVEIAEAEAGAVEG